MHPSITMSEPVAMAGLASQIQVEASGSSGRPNRPNGILGSHSETGIPCTVRRALGQDIAQDDTVLDLCGAASQPLAVR